jgi:colanic acid biosynthesis protein WcaH
MIARFVPDAEFAIIIRNTPLVSIDVIIVRTADGHVLTGLRTNEPAKGTYFVPGGVIRKNERVAEAFRRITSSELGVAIDISAATFLGVFEHFYETNRYGNSEYGTHYVVLGYEIKIGPDLQLKADDQHSELCWMSPSEIVANPKTHQNTKAYFLK